jgi:hypothetical protein
MHQILLLHIVPRMVFLKVVNLILVLVVPVMSWPVSEIRECEPLGDPDGVFGEGYGAAEIAVEEGEDLFHRGVFVGVGDVVCRGVFEAVGFEDIFGGPSAGVVVVVEGKEGSGVE